MRKAWEIFRSNGVRTMQAWSEALKSSWAIEKSEPVEIQISRAVEMAERMAIENEIQSQGYEEYWYRFEANPWPKENPSRIYLNLNYGRSRKWSRGVAYCVDVQSGKTSDVSRKYNNARERGIVEEIASQVSQIFA